MVFTYIFTHNSFQACYSNCICILRGCNLRLPDFLFVGVGGGGWGLGGGDVTSSPSAVGEKDSMSLVTY